jgi:hypothetical protein
MDTQRGIGRRGLGLALILAGGLLCGAQALAQKVAPRSTASQDAAPQNGAPVIAGTPAATAVVGQAYAFQPAASDPDGDRLVFRASGVPGWAKFDKRTGRLHGSPAKRHLGKSHSILISVTDGQLQASLPRFTLTVAASAPGVAPTPVDPPPPTVPPPTGSPPSIGGTPPASVVEGELYGFVPTASDPDGDALRFSISGKPAWATFTASSGLLSGIPPAGSAGTYSQVRISVSDGSSTASLPAFAITVTPKPNSPPTIWGIPPTSAHAGEAYSFRPSASDPEGQALRFQVAGLPAWASFDTASGTLRGTPEWSHAGTYAGIAISVSDGQASASLAPFAITVTATNTPPSISGTPPDVVKAGQAYSFAPTATDPEGQKLTFSIANRPAWASFDTATGRLQGTPQATNVGTHSGIVISASDGQYASALPAFDVTVLPDTKGSATVSWSPPTSFEDGTPIANLAGYRVVYGQSSSELSQAVTIASADITSATIEDLAPGTWFFAVKAYTTASVESDLSSVASKTIY